MTSEQLAHEIEQHKQTAEALRESESTVRALLDATTETALLIDVDGRILALNEIAHQRLKRLSCLPVGEQADELIGRCVFDLFPVGLTERRKARNDKVIQSGIPARFEDERNGTWMDNTIYPIFDARGNVVKLAIFSYDITDRKWAEITLQRVLREEQERARRDPLTGVLNHGAIMEELERLVKEPATDTTHAVLLVDADGLKALNDRYGHRTGDAALVALAGALSRGRAIVGRYGGDEFVVLIRNADRSQGERYKREVEAALVENEIEDRATGEAISVTASIGLAIHPEDAEVVPRLIEFADSRMYAAKRERAEKRAGTRGSLGQMPPDSSKLSA